MADGREGGGYCRDGYAEVDLGEHVGLLVGLARVQQIVDGPVFLLRLLSLNMLAMIAVIDVIDVIENNRCNRYNRCN